VGEWVSRRIDGLAPGLLRLRCRPSGIPRTGDLPLSGPALGHPGAEACRRRHLQLIVSLGSSLPCQVIPADLLVACTLAYRR
jgi:hypothetical protein